MDGDLMRDFIFIGFNIRIWPWDGEFNVDDTGWDLNNDIAEAVNRRFDVKQNEFQLLMPEDSSTMKEISNFILGVESANVAAIKIPTRIARLLDRKLGYKTSENHIELHNYFMRGFDVCDIDGLFSVLHNDELGRLESALFRRDEYLSALEFANFANFFDRGHAPYTLAEVHTLK